MSDRVQIQITATDGASRVFTGVASSADRMGSSFERAGRAGINMAGVADQLGRAFNTASIFLADSARLAAESEVSQQRLQAAIEASGASYDDYAEAIERAGEAAVSMAFDDEAAIDAISAITAATGDAAFAIDNLGLVMDIARGRGIDLAAAARIVIAAEQERFGSLARIGIQLDENATKEQALAALQQKYAGQAAAYAETTAGQYGELSERFENARESLARYSSEATTLALIIPTVTSAISTMNTALIATAGISLVGLAPAIAAIGIAAGTAYVGYTALTQQGDVTSQSMEDVAANALSVTEALLALGAAGESTAVAVGGATQTILNQATQDFQEMLRLTGELATFQPGRATQDEQVAHEANMQRLYELEQQYGDWNAAAGQVAEAEADLLSILQGSGPLYDQQLAALEATNTAFAEGRLTLPQYLAGLDMVADMTGNVGAGAQDAADATDGLMTAQERGAMAAREAASAQHETYDSILETRQATVDLTVALAEVIGQFAGVTNAVSAMDGVFQSTVGNTDAWGKSSQAIADWAETLIGAEGTAGRIDEILEGQTSGLAAATINQQEYTAAQAAYNDIVRENAEIQQNVAVIQAKQAPLIAEQIELTENYTQQIAEMSAEQATVALGFMDSAQAGKALELQTLAISAAQGELGEGGKAFAADIITGAAQADSQLRMMLESMGLIEVGADGTITVNWQDNASGPMQKLIDATEQLAYTQLLIQADMDAEEANRQFEEIFGHAAEWEETSVEATVSADTSQAVSAVTDAQNQVDTFGRSSASATIGVVDNATGVIYGAINALGDFAGRTATAYIQTIDLGVSGTRRGLGGVASYATGGMVRAEMAEWGPELLHFPNGGVALARDRGIYSVPQGTYVDTAPATAQKLGGMGSPAISIHIHGPSSWDDAAEQVSRKLVPAIQRAMREHDRSLGAYG
jgi:hypothetical protein